MKQKLSLREKAAFGMGAIGKDLAYMLSSSYVLYYYENICGVSAWKMGIILLIARVFDAFNDPIMGVIVAKTKSRFGKFRPWLFIGTILNAFFLYMLFAAPRSLDVKTLAVYAAIIYIIWGITYTMMDIPYWSMIPAFTDVGKERESLTSMTRACTGIGIAIISVGTIPLVKKLGDLMTISNIDREIERQGFMAFAFLTAILFTITIVLTCVFIKEKSTVGVEVIPVKEMWKGLFKNDQAVVMVVAVVLGNMAVYITSNLLIYLFKYDIARGIGWRKDYTIFNGFGGGVLILAMTFGYPLLRKVIKSVKLFKICAVSAIIGYIILLSMCFADIDSVYLLFIPGFLVYFSIGILNVSITVFLANTVDYGEYKEGHRDESIIFSMQTFCVKLASGLSALVASICLSLCKLSEDEDAVVTVVHPDSILGLRLTLSLAPAIVLAIALIIFTKFYKLTDEKMEEISVALKENEKNKKIMQQN